jgi:hypothetical protein
MKVSRIKETAYHEASHAFLALRYGLYFEGIDIVATEAQYNSPPTVGMAAGHLCGVEPLSFSNIETSIAVLLGGAAVKQIITPSCKGFALWLSGPRQDLEKVSELCRVFGLEGIQADRYRNKMLRYVREIINEHWDTIAKIGEALLASRHRRLSRRQVIRVAGGIRKVREAA